MSQKHKLFAYCKVKQKVVPIEEVQREYQSKAVDLFIQDEMPPTRNPLNPKEIYTSKSKLRAAYRAAGAIEVGDAYDKGYTPEKETKRSEREVVNKFMSNLRDRLNHGR